MGLPLEKGVLGELNPVSEMPLTSLGHEEGGLKDSRTRGLKDSRTQVLKDSFLVCFSRLLCNVSGKNRVAFSQADCLIISKFVSVSP